MHAIPQDAIWQDVFLTKPSEEIFIAPVMSVGVNFDSSGATGTAGDILLKPVKGGSDWLALAFPVGADPTEIAAWESLSVGDVLRVGAARHGGVTPSLTILETVDATKLINTGSLDWQIQQGSVETPVYPTTGGAYGGTAPTHLKSWGAGQTSRNWVGTASCAGAKRCVRVNRSIDATTLPTGLHLDESFTLSDIESSYVTDADRGAVSMYHTETDALATTPLAHRESLFFPCYRSATANNKPLRMQIPSNVKQLYGVKVLGYSLSTVEEHDWLALRIKEIRTNNGTVMSNNTHANGALHVIRGTSDAYEPLGLSCMQFSPVNFSGLTVEFVDHQGVDVQFNRVNIWLQLLVVSC